MGGRPRNARSKLDPSFCGKKKEHPSDTLHCFPLSTHNANEIPIAIMDVDEGNVNLVSSKRSGKPKKNASPFFFDAMKILPRLWLYETDEHRLQLFPTIIGYEIYLESPRILLPSLKESFRTAFGVLLETRGRSVVIPKRERARERERERQCGLEAIWWGKHCGWEMYSGLPLVSYRSILFCCLTSFWRARYRLARRVTPLRFLHRLPKCRNW